MLLCFVIGYDKVISALKGILSFSIGIISAKNGSVLFKKFIEI